MSKVSHEELIARQSLPLETKIELSKEAIRRWHEHWNGDVYVSFSGGMDSTVLLHLVRSVYPNVKGICVDALLYPEIRDHVRQTDNVLVIRPKRSFQDVISKCGYPVVSKRVSQYVHQVQTAKGESATKRLRLTGIRSNGTFSRMGMIAKKWQYLCNAPFSISDRCCYHLKKKPMDGIVKKYGYPFVGVRVEEGQRREQSYYLYGCNAFDIKRPRAWVLAFWTEKDIWDYVHGFDVAYSSIYDMGYTRTGCFACMFGVHLEKEPNRFQRMRITHPHLWKACEKWGIPRVLDYIGVSHEECKQMQLFDVVASGKVIFPI